MKKILQELKNLKSKEQEEFMKKLFLLVLLIIMLISILSGCTFVIFENGTITSAANVTVEKASTVNALAIDDVHADYVDIRDCNTKNARKK